MVKFWEMVVHQKVKTIFLTAVHLIKWPFDDVDDDNDKDEDVDDGDGVDYDEDDEDDDEVHTWRHATPLAFVSRWVTSGHGLHKVFMMMMMMMMM